MKEIRSFLLAEGRGLDIACGLYCCYLICTGEMGNPLFGGIAMVWALLFVFSPEYLVPPLFAAVCLDQNCFVAGMTASRYLTILFLAVNGLTMLYRHRIERRGLIYTILLMAYFTASTFLSQAGYSEYLFTMLLNILLVYFIAHLPDGKQVRIFRLLLWSCTAMLLYVAKSLIFGQSTVIQGRYWLLENTNPNRIGMLLTTIGLFYIAYAGWKLLMQGKKKTGLLMVAGYAFALYLIVLTGSRSAVVGVFGALVLASIVIVLQSRSSRERGMQAVCALVVFSLSIVVTTCGIPTPQEVAMTNPDIEIVDPGKTEQPVAPEQPGEAEQPAAPEQPGEAEQPAAPEQPGEAEQPAAPEQPGDTEQEEPSTNPVQMEMPESFDDMGVINRWDMVSAAQNGGFAGRFAIWGILWKNAILPNPLFGVGFSPENTTAVLQAHGDTHSGAHNILFAILTSIGFVGLALLAIPVILMLLRAALNLREQPLLLIPATLILGAICNGVGENIYIERYLWVSVGLCLWLLWTLPDKKAIEDTHNAQTAVSSEEIAHVNTHQ